VVRRKIQLTVVLRQAKLCVLKALATRLVVKIKHQHVNSEKKYFSSIRVKEAIFQFSSVHHDFRSMAFKVLSAYQF